MERKNALTVGSIVILIALAVFVWNVPDEGGSTVGEAILAPLTNTWTNPWDDADVASATAAGQSWLDSDSGANTFSDATAADAIPVFSEDKELIMWIVPVIEDGNYTGFIQYYNENLEAPDSYVEYPLPLESFITRDSAIDMHTFFILKYGTDYAPESISEPFIVIKSEIGGLFWMSEIVEYGQVVEKLYSDIRLVD
jgi:hypothetical protein